MGRCGRLLGVAFQIRDDMLGVWGAESQTGKPPAADIRRRKKSLPVVYALSRADSPAGEDLRRLYGQRELGDQDVVLVLRWLDALGAQEYCRRLAGDRKTAALAELDRLNLKSEAAAELKITANFLLEREF